MPLTFTVNGEKKNVSNVGNRYTLTYPCSSKETCYPYESTLPSGLYRFDVYGAGGGSYISGNDSPGGYSTGFLYLKEATKLFFFVGAKGVCVETADTATSKVFGGGGNGRNGADGKACSGGGASDIRVVKDNLKTRIIVAGAAGGSGYWAGGGESSNEHMIGGSGGGDSAAASDRGSK